MDLKFKFKFTKDEAEKLIRFLYKNNTIFQEKELRLKKLKTLLIKCILIVIFTSFLINKVLFYSIVKSILLSLIWVFVFLIIEFIYQKVVLKMNLMKTLSRLKYQGDRKICVEVCDDDIVINFNDERKMENINNCTIVYIDNERIYIRGTGIGVFYIPKSAFINQDILNEFLNLFKK